MGTVGVRMGIGGVGMEAGWYSHEPMTYLASCSGRHNRLCRNRRNRPIQRFDCGDQNMAATFLQRPMR